MNILLVIPIIVSFFITLVSLPKWIKKAGWMGLSWEDMNKYNKRKVSGSGGLIVAFAFVFSVLIYVAIKTFYFKSANNVIEIFAMLCSILILAFIGIVDDLFGWKYKGLSKRLRIILCILAAIPLMVINVGESYLTLPLLGRINVGLIYPLFLIPIGIAGASITFNFLAGYNGLESIQGILILSALSLVAYFTGNSWLALIGGCMIISLIVFYYFNKYPAKVFPGNVLTYSVGGLIAIIAILGNFEKFALFIFIPYFIEIFLKLRGKLEKQSFGKPNKDGSLDLLYPRIYSLNHFAIVVLRKIKPSHKVYEKDVVFFISILQIIFIIFGAIIFRKAIFV